MAIAGGGAEHGSTLRAATLSPLPAQIFELVNDNNLTWVSFDGRTWKAKQEYDVSSLSMPHPITAVEDRPICRYVTCRERGQAAAPQNH